jgi:hypothetical protein
VIGEYIDQYKTALRLLQANGEDVADYYVPRSAVRDDLGRMIDAHFLLARVRIQTATMATSVPTALEDAEPTLDDDSWTSQRSGTPKSCLHPRNDAPHARVIRYSRVETLSQNLLRRLGEGFGAPGVSQD